MKKQMMGLVVYLGNAALYMGAIFKGLGRKCLNTRCDPFAFVLLLAAVLCVGST